MEYLGVSTEYFGMSTEYHGVSTEYLGYAQSTCVSLGVPYGVRTQSNRVRTGYLFWVTTEYHEWREDGVPRMGEDGVPNWVNTDLLIG